MTRFVRIAPARLAALWADRGLTREAVAAAVGLTPHGLTNRVKASGLPLRGYCTKRPHVTDDALFAAMWRADVGVADMAEYFSVSGRTIGNTVDRLGLERRPRGRRDTMSALAFLMTRAAAETQAAMVCAEMVDQIGRGGIVRLHRGAA